MENKLSSLSVILPAYNEEKNIGKMIDKAMEVFPKFTNDLEIIVVNDGSKDKTSSVVKEKASQNKLIILIEQKNMGYGGALKTGFANAKKDWIFFTDSDLQFDLNEFGKFVEESSEFDFIFGYRIKRADKFSRIVIAKMLKVWNKIFLNFPIYIKDIDCAFKLMKREKFESIGEIYSSGAMITTEFILKIHKQGYKIKQIGVHHYPRIHGKSTGSNFGVIKKAVKDTFVIRKLVNNN